jgi:hypothetical protein
MYYFADHKVMLTRTAISILLVLFVACNSSTDKQASDQKEPDQDIAKVFGELTLDTPPEELCSLFNQFCQTYYGAERDQLIYEKFGNELEVKENSRWNYFSEKSAIIAWETNLPAKTYVEYGTGKNYRYKSDIQERNFYIHVHYLKNLKKNTRYHYKLVSIDERGNKTESGEMDFSTRVIDNAIHIQGDLGSPPYILDKKNTIYIVTEDIIADRTAFNIAAPGITIDLGGHTITHANHLIPELDYLNLEKAGVGIRRVDDDTQQSGLTILNGTIKQGAAKNNQDYTAAKDMLRPDPERKKRLEKNSSRGFSNIEITNYGDVEIAGVTVEYHFPQTWGMRFESAYGKYNIHHNIVTDKGNQLFNRHGGGTVRSIGFRSGSGVYTSKYRLNNDDNEIQVHHNLIKRTRHNALNIAQKIYNNEIYVDSWAVNSFAISPHKYRGQVHDNKIFLTGYYACGILWATSDLTVSNNFIHLESMNTMIEKPLNGRRLIETWGEQDVVAGMRLTNYGKGGQKRENLSYTNNLIIGHCRGEAEMRGTEFYSDYSIRNLVIRTIILSFLSLAESKKIEYRYDLAESSDIVFFDSDKLEKILTNLISNAFKFTAEGAGTVTIKNGVIKNGSHGVLSWGIQSTAGNVRIILDNVKFITSGINTVAVDVPHATIINCRFEVLSPFIINRHGSEFYAVDLRGLEASEVSFSEFYGGQGCLVFKGEHSIIHHNRFVNRQTVTNHYSVMAMGDSSMIFENRFEPEIGSGLEIFRHKHIEIFNNLFRIKAAPPSCEYHEHYSTNAIRVADYGAELESPRGCFGNRIYNNKFYITGKKFKQYPEFIPMASAFFFSTSAGENYIFGNQIHIEQEDPDTDAEAYAFYIGNSRGGQFYNNRITSNVTPIWVACGYGSATGTMMAENQFIRSPTTVTDFKPVRMGWIERTDCLAKDIEFRSNEFEGLDFGIDATKQNHSYSVYWTMAVNVTDKKGKEVSGAKVTILNKNKEEVLSQMTNSSGSVKIELPEYSIDGELITYLSPYTILVNKKKEEVSLNSNQELTIIVK